MPVLAPPPLTPAPGPIEIIRQQPSVLRLTFQNQQRTVQIEVSGASILSADVAKAAIRRAASLSDAVYELAKACADAGYPVAQLIYARSGDTVYVQVELHGLSEVRGPRSLTRFFDGLDEQPLTENSLERRRLLASIYADSTGLAVQPTLIADDAGYVLDFKPNDVAPRWPGVDLSFGNPGNRFVGRYFGSLSAQYGFESGIALRGSWLHGFPELDRDGDAGDYDEQNLALNHVSPLGVFGISARNVDYQQAVQDPRPRRPAQHFKGDTRQIEASLAAPLKAAAHWRWLGGVGLIHTQRQVDNTSTDSRVQDQQYTSLQASTAYKSEFLSFTRYPTELSAGITLRFGLGDDRRDDEQVAANLNYRLVRPELSARLALNPIWQLAFRVNAQFTDDTVPVEEQWVLGGTDNIQAWLPGVSVGDSGVLLRLEAQRRGWQLGPVQIRPTVFSEYAVSALNDDGAGSERQRLADVGVGLAAQLSGVMASLTTAQPIHDHGFDKPEPEDSRARLLFSVKARF